MKKSTYLIILILFFSASDIFSQFNTESIIDAVKNKYKPESFKKDTFLIIKEIRIPGDFETFFKFDENSTASEFQPRISRDTIISMKKGANFIIFRKGGYFLPEIYGDEMKNWLDLVPNPLSADFHTPGLYKLMEEVLEFTGIEKYHGYECFVMKVKINRLGNRLGIKFLNTENYDEIYLFFDQKDFYMRGAAFEMNINEKSPINLKHQIVFKNYKKFNGMILPTKIERHNVDFVKSGLSAQMRNKFQNNINQQLNLLKNLKSQCSEKLDNAQKLQLCRDYYQAGIDSYSEINEMFKRDHFILNYKIIDVIDVDKDHKVFDTLYRR